MAAFPPTLARPQPPGLRLWIRHTGPVTGAWQYPLLAGDVVEVRDATGMRTLTVLSEELLVTMIAHYLTGHALTAAIGHGTAPAPPEPVRTPLAPATTRQRLYDPARLARLAARRRTRK